ncbi:hypothetical protein HCJ46_06475 [Listeria booriae]|uniref:hypothetical protein n=1 Tax=Listeria booriae TaxID=1552123 RepID=UPI00162446D8|nr:hypothetical protein [Listeria booriae]MBC1918393.1 hypothetical protein [Listeria booriae]MBC2206157.1 hypothetical protein [Listeria booriae]
MDNNSKGNIGILIFLVSLFSAIWSLVIFPEGFGLIWLIGSVVVLVVATIYLVRWNKQAKKQVSTCTIPVEATVQWWETSSRGQSGVLFFLVLSIPWNGSVVEKAYSTGGGMGVVELTQFLNRYPFGSRLMILTNGKGLSNIVIQEIDYAMSDNGEKLVLERFARSKNKNDK